MKDKLGYVADSIIQALDTKPELVKIYLIPIVLFLLDFFLRAFIGADLSDAGADMALLGVASFIMIIADEHGKSHHRPIVMVVFHIMFMLPWVFCLWSVSKTNPLNTIKVSDQIIDTHFILNMLSWFVGLTSLILSGVFISRLTLTDQIKPSGD